MKRKILLVAFNDLGLGGIQNVIINTVRHLSNEFIFDIVCFDDARTDFNKEFLSFGGNIFVVNENNNLSPQKKKLDFYFGGKRIKKQIERIIRANGPYIAVHSHKEILSGPVLKAAKKCGVPVRVAHAHTAFSRHYNPAAKLRVAILKRQIKKYATDMVGCSNNACRSLFGEGENYKVIFNAIDEKYKVARIKNTNNDYPTLIQVGMICDNKNQAFSLSVISELKKQYQSAKLILVGEPKDAVMQKYLFSLKETVKENGIEDNVQFLAAGADLSKLYGEADYMILPSRAEGLAITALEAQATGLLCFVSTAVPSETDCGGCVYLSLERGAKQWARKIAERFSADGGKKKKYDLSPFLPDAVMAEYKKIYKKGEV